MRAVVIVVAAVIAIIGIGVGLVGGLPPSEYGPPGEQFSVAFPHMPVVKSLPGGAREYATAPTRAQLRGPNPEQQLYRSVVVGSVAEFLADPLYRRPTSLISLLHRSHFQQIGDYELSRTQVTCSGAFCTGDVVARRGDEIWLVSTLGLFKPAPSLRFLASFGLVG